MVNYVTPRIKQLYTKIIDNLRSDIGRSVKIIGIPIEMDCPNCGWDPIKNASNGKYEPINPYPLSDLVNAGVTPTGPINFIVAGMRTCPVCRGKGKYTSASNISNVTCLINALPPQDAEKTPLGKNYVINYELQASLTYRSTFMTAQKVVVDGTVCAVVAVIPTGIGDLTQINVYVGGGV